MKVAAMMAFFMVTRMVNSTGATPIALVAFPQIVSCFQVNIQAGIHLVSCYGPFLLINLAEIPSKSQTSTFIALVTGSSVVRRRIDKTARILTCSESVGE